VGDELDARKLTILKAIIRNYLETGEPVGSRTISKYTDPEAFVRHDPQ
jgi:heat-inducible transcriptional repressor